MKKLLYFIVILLTVSTLEGCDTEKNRKSKAEDLIKQHMFETLSDFKSYEPISLELDTIEEDWISAPGIIDLARQYKTALDEQDEIVYSLQDLESALESKREEVAHEFIFGNSANALWNGGSRLVEMKNRVKAKREQRDIALKYTEGIENQILSKYDSIPDKDKQKFQGWHAIHKFRAKDKQGVSYLALHHYYLTPDLKTIIIDWDEDDESSDTPAMLTFVSALINFRKIELPDSI